MSKKRPAVLNPKRQEMMVQKKKKQIYRCPYNSVEHAAVSDMNKTKQKKKQETRNRHDSVLQPSKRVKQHNYERESIEKAASESEWKTPIGEQV